MDFNSLFFCHFSLLLSFHTQRDIRLTIYGISRYKIKIKKNTCLWCVRYCRPECKLIEADHPKAPSANTVQTAPHRSTQPSHSRGLLIVWLNVIWLVFWECRAYVGCTNRYVQAAWKANHAQKPSLPKPLEVVTVFLFFSYICRKTYMRLQNESPKSGKCLH